MAATLFVVAALLVPGGAATAALAISATTAVPSGRPWLSWGAPKAVDPDNGGWFSLDCPDGGTCLALDGAGNS